MRKIYIDTNGNIDFIKNTKHEIELLNPKKHLFTSTKSYLESLTSSELKYCLSHVVLFVVPVPPFASYFIVKDPITEQAHNLHSTQLLLLE